MNPGPLLAFAAGLLVLGVVGLNRLSRVWLVLVLAAMISLLVACAGVLSPGGSEWQWRSGFAVAGEALHFRLDAISAWFLALLAVLGGCGAVYAHSYWADRHHPRSAPAGRRWWSGLLLCLLAVLLASNGLHFLIAWELFAVCGFFLITLERRRREVRFAGWLYLVASHTGTLCLFAFFAALAARLGTWDLGPMREQAALAPLLWLALAGFAVKAGVFPLHVWLPSAHANAPSHVSAAFSGVAIKMGIYGIVRFSGWLPAPDGAAWIVVGLGAVGAVLGIAFALVQNDLKRLLAYSSVENIGVILIGIGTALLASRAGNAGWGRLALAGALLHVWNHGLFKGLLFFSAGSVLHATGTREMSRLGGLWRGMPWTTALFAVGAIAVSALPPLNGFVSEWLIYLGLFDATTSRGPAAWAAMPAAILLAMTGALALATFVKASAITFLGAARTKAAHRPHESDWWMRGPMLLLAALCVFLGLAPLLAWPLVSHAAGVWAGGISASAPPAPLSTLTGVHVGFAVALLMAIGLLTSRSRRRGLRRAPTWDCGYAAPTARMQYTSGALAGIAGDWFSPVLRFDRIVHRPRALFPQRGLYVERALETVLDGVLRPVANAVLRVSTLVRQLQHGRLQLYIVYVLVGLAGLGALVAWEGFQ